MGESMVEAPQMDNKMGESNGSVSFGKYESDALCWEKWSSFSPNKYLEEVGKCSTPGSVAQKKAFFEAHYKKVAAMKAEAELLDQQKATQTDDPSRSDEYTEHSCVEIIKEVDEDCPEIKVCHNEEQVKAEISLVNNQRNNYNDQYHCTAEATTTTTSTSVNDDSFRDEKPIEMNSSSKADKLEEAVLVNNESMKLVKRHFQMDLETNERKKESQHIAQKVKNPTKMEKNLVGMMKKPETSFARLTKPNVTPTPVPKRENSSSLKIKTPYLSQSMRVSHHLSMSMTSENSDVGSSITSSRRRSLFMEQMGDKDIVKRVFKTFQNRANQLPSPDSRPKQLLTNRLEKKASTSTASQKENNRSKKAGEKISPVRGGQFGPTWKSVDQGRMNSTPTSVILTSNEKAERRKKFCKNLEEKSNARVAERSQVKSKSKEQKDVYMKRVGQNLSFKAKPMPNFYRTQGLSKSTSEKETLKTGTLRRPDPQR